jgi:hypothetical protein
MYLLLQRRLDLGADGVRPIEREGSMSAIRRLGVGVRILEPFDGQKDGHRENYVLVVDEGIARYMEGLGQQVRIGMSARWIGWRPTL